MDFKVLHSSADIVEEVAEEFVFGRLSPTDLDSYEQHLLVCDRCRRAVEEADEFISMFRGLAPPKQRAN